MAKVVAKMIAKVIAEVMAKVVAKVDYRLLLVHLTPDQLYTICRNVSHIISQRGQFAGMSCKKSITRGVDNCPECYSIFHLVMIKTILIFRIVFHDLGASRIIFNKPYKEGCNINFFSKHPLTSNLVNPLGIRRINNS